MSVATPAVTTLVDAARGDIRSVVGCKTSASTAVMDSKNWGLGVRKWRKMRADLKF